MNLPSQENYKTLPERAHEPTSFGKRDKRGRVQCIVNRASENSFVALFCTGYDSIFDRFEPPNTISASAAASPPAGDGKRIPATHAPTPDRFLPYLLFFTAGT